MPHCGHNRKDTNKQKGKWAAGRDFPVAHLPFCLHCIRLPCRSTFRHQSWMEMLQSFKHALNHHLGRYLSVGGFGNYERVGRLYHVVGDD